MALTTLSPLRDFMAFREAMDRFVEDRWLNPDSWLTVASAGRHYIPLDVYETGNDIVVRALVPGALPEDIDVEVEHGVLTIRARTSPHEPQDGATWLLNEIGSGQAMRQFTLPRPVDIDAATTTFENGVLTLTLPKTPEARPKQIKVGSAKQIGAGVGSA